MDQLLLSEKMSGKTNTDATGLGGHQREVCPRAFRLGNEDPTWDTAIGCFERGPCGDEESNGALVPDLFDLVQSLLWPVQGFSLAACNPVHWAHGRQLWAQQQR